MPARRPTHIELIPLAMNDRRLSIPQLAYDVEAELRVPVRIVDLRIDLEQSFDPSRGQYHSGQLLTTLLDARPDNGAHLLAVAGYDLFLPVLTFVFGQAQLSNRGAVFSIFRLHNEFYGLPPESMLLQQRATKEALHELGHTFGLRHCFDEPCVMNSSTYVEDIDFKPAAFCMHCSTFLRYRAE
jgi:archaemetzincin